MSLVNDYESCKNAAKSLKTWAPGYCICTTLEIHNNLNLKEYMLLTSKLISDMDADGKINLKKALTMKTVRDISSKCQSKIAEEM